MNGRLTLLIAWPLLLTCDTAGQLAFKLGSAALVEAEGLGWLGAILGSPWIWAGALGYVGSFVSWMLILRQTDLSLAFPVTSLGYVMVLIASQLLLGETVDTVRWLGVGCIVGGFLVMIGEKAEAAAPAASA